ncbi:hypothetical protein JCM10914A_09900 [Paenibacillus sp. JCM 10914]|uniref:GNAT family N-acetyltransferase n=1 Tax=Paenibacillus sp. JCM 10914 TaxID=1236974 RepID=UPI0003CC8D60|nr:GNAT family N-acetyltransferase [Paenibacillus sp. JCM 10914]GAE07320.1 cellulose biosynthesis protein [Paenibacillus sp. JCM 10914]
MNITIITDHEGFLGIREDWERLEKLDKQIAYYSTFRFNYSWWLAFGEDRNYKLFIICCYRDQQIVGIAPLMIRRNDKMILSCNVLCFIGQGDYLDMLVDNRHYSAQSIIKNIFMAIQENSSEWDRISLTHIHMNSRLLHYLQRHDTYNPHIEYLTSCPRMNMREYGSFEQLSEDIFNKKMRKKPGKMQKQIPYTFRVIRGSQSEDIYDRISYVHKQEKDYLQNERGRTERRSVFDDEHNEAFYRTLFRGNEDVVIFLLESQDGEIIIYSCCYLFGNVSYDWNTGYTPKYAGFHGIADVLQMEIVQYLFENRVADQIDLGAGAYSWKFRWTNQFVVNYAMHYWNPSNFSSSLLHGLVKTRRFLQKGVLA